MLLDINLDMAQYNAYKYELEYGPVGDPAIEEMKRTIEFILTSLSYYKESVGSLLSSATTTTTIDDSDTRET